jgi:hypothetical protein
LWHLGHGTGSGTRANASLGGIAACLLSSWLQSGQMKISVFIA